jgi:hypothetical protein
MDIAECNEADKRKMTRKEAKEGLPYLASPLA